MERTQIINELRRFEITGDNYNNISPTKGKKYYIQFLDHQYNIFFEDLRFFLANREKEIISLYIIQALKDLEESRRQLAQKLSWYLEEAENEDTTYIRTMNAIQNDYIKKMKHRLSDTLNVMQGKPTYYNLETEPQQIDFTDTYKNLLADYEDLLTTTDLVKIFKTTRQTIHNWEVNGKIQRITHDGHPRFLKSSIMKILIENYPELISKYQNKI